MIIDVVSDVIPLAGMNNNFGTHFTWIYQCSCSAYNSLPHHRWGCDRFECYSCDQINLIENDSQFNSHHCIKGVKATNSILDFYYKSAVIVEKYEDVKSRFDKAPQKLKSNCWRIIELEVKCKFGD